MKLTDEFRELLLLFNASGVKYVLVGGYALAYHGHPRATKDIDLHISTDELNARRVQDALLRFGFDEAPPLSDITDPQVILRFGAPPTMVDLIKHIDGVLFEEAYGSAEEADIDGVPVRVINREHLVANKRASGRYQDLADLQALGEIPPASPPR